jgi:hypothetical protein
MAQVRPGDLRDDEKDGGQDCEPQRRNEGVDEKGLGVSQEAVNACDPPLKAFNSWVGVGRRGGDGGGERESKRARRGGACH